MRNTIWAQEQDLCEPIWRCVGESGETDSSVADVFVSDVVKAAFRDGALRTTGTAITKVLPPVSRFSKDKNHSAKQQRVIQLLGEFFERFFGLSTGRDA